MHCVLFGDGTIVTGLALGSPVFGVVLSVTSLVSDPIFDIMSSATGSLEEGPMFGIVSSAMGSLEEGPVFGVVSSATGSLEEGPCLAFCPVQREAGCMKGHVHF